MLYSTGGCLGFFLFLFFLLLCGGFLLLVWVGVTWFLVGVLLFCGVFLKH